MYRAYSVCSGDLCKINTKITLKWVHEHFTMTRSYIILFLSRHNKPIHDDKKVIFTHWLCFLPAVFMFCWCHNTITRPRAHLFSKSSLARLQGFWNSSICLYEIKKKNLSKSTCPTGSFTCHGPSGSGKWRALWPDNCDASSWKVISNSLDISDIHSQCFYHFSALRRHVVVEIFPCRRQGLVYPASQLRK